MPFKNGKLGNVNLSAQIMKVLSCIWSAIKAIHILPNRWENFYHLHLNPWSTKFFCKKVKTNNKEYTIHPLALVGALHLVPMDYFCQPFSVLHLYEGTVIAMAAKGEASIQDSAGRHSVNLYTILDPTENKSFVLSLRN